MNDGDRPEEMAAAEHLPSSGKIPISPGAWGHAPHLPQSLSSSARDGLRRAELERDEQGVSLRKGLAHGDPAWVDFSIWTVARIGGRQAATRLLGLLDGGQGPQTLAAVALLLAPVDSEGNPRVPSEVWKQLEDSLWTRYAVTEDPLEAEGLLFAIARLGGPESVARLAVDLEGSSHANAPARSARMEALGLLCVRGWSLDPAARDVVVGGLDAEEGSVRQASLYTLGRCVSASSELLAIAAEREKIVKRLAGLVRGAPVVAALAWKVLAAIGEVPPSIPEMVLSPVADRLTWKVEVEAVRALAASPKGRQTMLERLRTFPVTDDTVLASARVHGLLEALRALRPHAGGALEISALAERWLSELAHREDSLDSLGSELARVHLRLELETLGAIAAGDLRRLPDCSSAFYRGSNSANQALPVFLPRGYCERAHVEGIMHMTQVRRVALAAVESKDLRPLLPDSSGGDRGAETEDPRSSRVARILLLAEDPDPSMAAPALEALAEIADPRAKKILRDALQREDLGVRAAAATSLATRSVDAERRDLEAVGVLRQAVLESTNSEAIEVRLASIRALGALARTARSSLVEGGESRPSPVASPWLQTVLVPLAADPNASIRAEARRALGGGVTAPTLLESFQRAVSTSGREMTVDLKERDHDAVGLRFETTRGAVTIRFDGVYAPINQANLVHLAEQGVFDGLRFHRVVPNFVVQGGDPHGDGYGGPGYLVPCEWSNLRYLRGTVGMALAGKDTGGSQFFVTQSPQPHLDGRYTVVGNVSEGMEVIDLLLPGDRIESVEVLRR